MLAPQPAAGSMPVCTALKLRSLEGYLYCFGCGHGLYARKCTFYGQRHRFPGETSVDQMISIKRRDSWYFALVQSMTEEGQREPIEVCAEMTCVREGHHRIAAAKQLGWSHLDWRVSTQTCIHAPVIPPQIQQHLDDYARADRFAGV